MRSRRGSAVFLFLKSVLRQTAFFDYKCDNRSRHQIEENNDSLQYERIVHDGKPTAIRKITAGSVKNPMSGELGNEGKRNLPPL